jgi:transketolase
MGQRVIFVMTHDSIGLGEDGPTHQPVEHLAALRAMPNLNVFRPADAMETAECWQLALESANHPSVIALTRQNLPAVRTTFTADNLSARGAYELAAANGDAEVSIFASGSEVEIALAAKALIDARGFPARVVSVPCFELFAGQDEDYRTETLGDARVNLAIEAAVRQSWARFIGREGLFIGMAGFGASAPYGQLYEKFGITAEAAAEAAIERLTANV